MNIQKIIKDYIDGISTNELAKEYSTYPGKISKILKKNGVVLRSRSEAQSVALSSGTAKHPTAGKKLSEETKNAISEARAEAWSKMSKEDKDNFRQQAKKNWDALSEAVKDDMRSKAGTALREASKNGSKIEKYLQEKLIKAGYKVNIHRKNIGGEYEVDLYLEELKIAIEIDGPQHFLPIFGEEKLQKTLLQDEIKNGLLLGKGIHVVRIKYDSTTGSDKYNRDIWNKLVDTVQQIESGKISGVIEV